AARSSEATRAARESSASEAAATGGRPGRASGSADRTGARPADDDAPELVLSFDLDTAAPVGQSATPSPGAASDVASTAPDSEPPAVPATTSTRRGRTVPE